MGVLRFIVSRKILVTLMVFFIFIMGIFTAGKLDRELFPAISFDGAQIYANAGKMTTLDVEAQVTKPIEQVLQTIEGIKTYTSSSSIGVSSIIVFAEEGLGEEVFKEIEGKMKGFESQLSGVEQISTFQFSTQQPYEFYMTIADGQMDEMSNFARNIVKPRLEALPEVREVALEGIEKSNVVVELDLQKLRESGLTQHQVIQMIQQSNIDTSIATLEKEVGKPTVRWKTAIQNVEDLKAIEIPSSQGTKRLSELANIFAEKNTTSSVGWQNGTKDFIFVQIGRVSDVTQIEMAASIREELSKIREEGLINGFNFDELVAQADYVTDAIDGVSNNVMLGGLFALVILILFLRNIRATIIVGLSIPLSILLTFIGMGLFDYSFNMLTLIGLGLGIGMMVDSSIVILESIYRKKEEGLKKLDAVLVGVKEVATAVLASMLTTIVVFVPIGLLGGEMGQFMIILSMIVVITLVSSVIVAFTLIPTLSENFLKLKNKRGPREDGPIIKKYSLLVSWITKKKRNRYGMIVLFMTIFISSIMLLTKVPMTVMPDVLNRYAEIMVQLEGGLTPEEREEVALKINETILAVDDIENNLIMDNIDYFYVLVNMTKGDAITVEQSDINDAMNKGLRSLEDNYPVVSVGAADFSGQSLPVVIEIKGEELDKLGELAEGVMKELEKVDGVVGVTSSSTKQMKEQIIQFKKKNMEDDGITNLQLFSQFQEWSERFPIGQIEQDGLKTPIFVKTNVDIHKKEDLLNQELMTLSGPSKLSNYIELKEIETPTKISRKDGERMVTVLADIEGRDLGSVNRDIEKLLKDYQVPKNYSISIGGSLKEQQEAQEDMLMILGIALFLVYVVMAVQFNSFIHPFIVMSVIPMTVTGAIIGLLVTGSELSIMSGMGMVFLIGIILNNAILLIDRTKQLRVEGLSVNEAIIEAGKNRLRPIFMTTLTTVAGMLPLAVATGSASNYQAPLAIVIISGLLFATCITLLLIPSVYLLFEDVKSGFRRLFRKKTTRKHATISS